MFVCYLSGRDGSWSSLCVEEYVTYQSINCTTVVDICKTCKTHTISVVYITQIDHHKSVNDRCVLGNLDVILIAYLYRHAAHVGVFGILLCSIFIRPSSDGTYYGMVMSVRPGLRPTLRPSVRLSVRPSNSPSVRVSVRMFSTLFSYMLWHIELKFCTSLCFNVLQIKFEWRHFASIFEGVMPLLELRI